MDPKIWEPPNRKTKTNGNFNVCYCKTCKLSYEVFTYGGRKFLRFYEDMPTYKLERMECPKHEDDMSQYEEEYA